MNYRKDIQVYRGIAVTGVVLFHLFPSTFKNGFLGVDVFFVISGFLMANLYQIGDKKKKFKDFIGRRLNRIVPAYLGTLYFFILIGVVVYSPYDFYQAFKQALSGIFFVPNFYFWMQNDYFEDLNFSPFLHYWSLGVELQYYCLVPLLTFLFEKSYKWVGIVLILSLFICISVVNFTPSSAFFMLPFRMWEFLIGYYILWLFNLKIRPPSIIFFCVLFILLILLFGDINFHPHPREGAVLTTLLISYLLAFPPNLLYLKNKFCNLLELLGKYSYSVYLVHMPLISIIWYKPLSSVQKDVTLDSKLLLYLFLCFVLTSLSYFLFERRKFDLFKSKYRYINVVFSLVLLILPLKLINEAYNGENLVAISYAKLDVSSWRCGALFKLYSILKNKKACLIEGEEDRSGNLLLVGDSHANSIKLPISEAASKAKYNSFMYDASCLPGQKSCTIDNIISVARDLKIDKVIIHGLHYKIDFASLKRLIDKAPKSLDLYVIKPIPIYSVDNSIPRLMYIHNKNNLDFPILKKLKDVESDYNKYNEEYLMLEKAGYRLIEVTDVFCMPECIYFNSDGLPLYYDNHHLTNSGAKMLSDRFYTSLFTDVI